MYFAVLSACTEYTAVVPSVQQFSVRVNKPALGRSFIVDCVACLLELHVRLLFQFVWLIVMMVGSTSSRKIFICRSACDKLIFAP